MIELNNLRDELRTTCIRFGVSVGSTALGALMYAENFAPRPLLGIATVLALGQAAHDGLRAHTLGQEIASVAASSQQVS